MSGNYKSYAIHLRFRICFCFLFSVWLHQCCFMGPRNRHRRQLCQRYRNFHINSHRSLTICRCHADGANRFFFASSMRSGFAIKTYIKTRFFSAVISIPILLTQAIVAQALFYLIGLILCRFSGFLFAVWVGFLLAVYPSLRCTSCQMPSTTVPTRNRYFTKVFTLRRLIVEIVLLPAFHVDAIVLMWPLNGFFNSWFLIVHFK